MKNLIKQILKEYAEEQEKVLTIPSLKIFNYDWNTLQKFLKSKGNPKWKILGNLNLTDYSVESLKNLTSVGGNLNLENSPIKSLGNLKSIEGYLNLNNTSIISLGNLESVSGNMNLSNTPIKSLGNLTSVGGYLNLERSAAESFGNLQSVGDYLNLYGTPLSQKYSREEIRQMVNVSERIYK
jgi:hypothetical protein